MSLRCKYILLYGILRLMFPCGEYLHTSRQRGVLDTASVSKEPTREKGWREQVSSNQATSLKHSLGMITKPILLRLFLALGAARYARAFFNNEDSSWLDDLDDATTSENQGSMSYPAPVPLEGRIVQINSNSTDTDTDPRPDNGGSSPRPENSAAVKE
ncbi:hypothetical protein FA15DRAFT_658175 [Coprinopsis marcescibilis]|uniref:Uncharacterized protein n=1 Tax=Coprinopsis marcescibilis TaxID=230819 RepID=A0A5C3L073_COPMA|nr:hypothetical protein FA15DRAFT_658175 [Coprinopsis marcescibilis]